MAKAQQTIVIIGHEAEVSWEGNLIVAASHDESAQGDLVDLLFSSKSVEQNAVTVLYSPHPVCIQTMGLIPELLSCKAYAIEGLAINHQDPESKQVTCCGITPDLYFTKLNELNLAKTKEMWYGDMGKLQADHSTSEARQLCRAQILSQNVKLPDNITEAIGFANYELQYQADGQWRPLKLIYIFTHNEALEYVKSQNSLETRGTKIKFVEFTLECDLTSHPPPPERGDCDVSKESDEEQDQEVGTGAYVEEIVIPPPVSSAPKGMPSVALPSRQVSGQVEVTKVTPPLASVRAPPSLLPQGPPKAPSSKAPHSLKEDPPIKKPPQPTSKLVKISTSDEVSIKSEGQLLFEDLQLQSDKSRVSKSLFTTVYKAYVQTLCGTLHQQFEEQVRKCEEQLTRLGEESRVKDAQYKQLLQVKRMLEEKALRAIEEIHARKKAEQEQAAQMHDEAEVNAAQLTEEIEGQVKANLTKTESKDYPAHETQEPEQASSSALSEIPRPNLLDDRLNSSRSPSGAEETSNAEMLSILSYEFNEDEHCLEIKNNTSAPLTNMMLYCQTIDHYSEAFKFEVHLNLLPVDFELDSYFSQTMEFKFWIVNEDRVRCSNVFVVCFEDDQDTTSASFSYDTSEAVSSALATSQDYVLIEAECDAELFTITLTSQLTEPVAGSLVAAEFEGSLHENAELMPNVPLSLSYEAFEGLSLLSLKFISTEGEVLGASNFQLI